MVNQKRKYTEQVINVKSKKTIDLGSYLDDIHAVYLKGKDIIFTSKDESQALRIKNLVEISEKEDESVIILGEDGQPIAYEEAIKDYAKKSSSLSGLSLLNQKIGDVLGYSHIIGYVEFMVKQNYALHPLDKKASSFAPVKVDDDPDNNAPVIDSSSSTAKDTVTEDGDRSVDATTGGRASGSIVFNNSNISDDGIGDSYDFTIFDKNGKDQGHSHDSAYGIFTIDGEGNWSYVLKEPTPDAVNALGVDDDPLTDRVIIQVSDGSGGSDEIEVTVSIKGSNDAPIIDGTSSQSLGTVIEDSADNNQASGSIEFSDVDSSDSHIFSVIGEGVYGDFSVDSSGNWSYVLKEPTPDAVNALGVDDDPLTDRVIIQVSDGSGGTDNIEVTVSIQGTNDAPIVSNDTVSATVVEGADNSVTDGTGAKATGTIIFSDVDKNDTLSYTLKYEDTTSTSGSIDGKYGTFTYDEATNTWTYVLDDPASNPDLLALDKGENPTEVITIEVSDGHGGTISSTITVTIKGTNDAPVIDDASSRSTVTDVDTAEAPIIEAGEEVSGLVGLEETLGSSVAEGQVIASDSNIDDNDTYTDSLTFKVTGITGADMVDQITDDGTNYILKTEYGIFTINKQTGEWNFDGAQGSGYASLKQGDFAEFSISIDVQDSFGSKDSSIIKFKIAGKDQELRAVHEYGQSNILTWVERDDGAQDLNSIKGKATISNLTARSGWVVSQNAADIMVNQPITTFGSLSTTYWILTKGEYQVVIDTEGNAYYTGTANLGANEVVYVGFEATITDKHGNSKQVIDTILTGSDGPAGDVPNLSADGHVLGQERVDYAAYSGNNGVVDNEQSSSGYNATTTEFKVTDQISAVNGGYAYLEFNGFKNISLDGGINIGADSYLNLLIDTPNRGDDNRNNDNAGGNIKVHIGDLTVAQGAIGADIKVIGGSVGYTSTSNPSFSTGAWNIGGAYNNIQFIARSENPDQAVLGQSFNIYANYNMGATTFTGGQTDYSLVSFMGDYYHTQGGTLSNYWLSIPKIQGIIDDITLQNDAVVNYAATGLYGYSSLIIDTWNGQSYKWDIGNVLTTGSSTLNMALSLGNIGGQRAIDVNSDTGRNAFLIDSLSAEEDSTINFDIAGVTIGNIETYNAYFQESTGMSIDKIETSDGSTLNFQAAFQNIGDYTKYNNNIANLLSYNYQNQGMFFDFETLAGINNIDIAGVNLGDSERLNVANARLIALGYTGFTNSSGYILMNESNHTEGQGMTVTGELNMNIYGASSGTITDYQNNIEDFIIDGVRAKYHFKLGDIDLTDMTDGTGLTIYGLADTIVQGPTISTIFFNAGDFDSITHIYQGEATSLATSSAEDVTIYGLAREIEGQIATYGQNYYDVKTERGMIDIDLSNSTGGVTVYGLASIAKNLTIENDADINITTGAGNDIIYTMFDFSNTQGTLNWKAGLSSGQAYIDAGSGDDVVYSGVGYATSSIYKHTYEGGAGTDTLVLAGKSSDYTGIAGSDTQTLNTSSSNANLMDSGAGHHFTATNFEKIQFTEDDVTYVWDGSIWGI